MDRLILLKRYVELKISNSFFVSNFHDLSKVKFVKMSSDICFKARREEL